LIKNYPAATGKFNLNIIAYILPTVNLF